MFPRYSADKVRIALSDTPVVFVMGARQVGKTTLVQSLIEEMNHEDWEYISLDDDAQLEIIQADPVGFIRDLKLMLFMIY